MFGFFVTIPHSGEKISSDTPWLWDLPETTLMCDVDRYVDVLYQESLKQLEIPFVKTEWHRYVVDLNRIPDDIDSGSVEGSPHPKGMFSRGFHWTMTTTGEVIMAKPLSHELHLKLKKLVYEPFHAEVQNVYQNFHQMNKPLVYHLDAHSMPSVGTSMHRDPGEKRADVVISDSHGKSCSPYFRDLVIAAYATAGLKTAYNWPYFGGRLTEQYGNPSQNQHVLQVELNRALYMDEVSKKILPQAQELSQKIKRALSYIQQELPFVTKRIMSGTL